MSDGSESKMANPARVLMFSQRNIYKDRHFMASLYEFEDIICSTDSVEMIAPHRLKWFKTGKRIALKIGEKCRVALNPGIATMKLGKDYDLFFAVCQFPSELLMVNAIKGWKDYCRTSVCLLSEIWLKDITLYKSSLKVLSEFDYVFLNHSQSVEGVSKEIQGECLYLPHGIDTILFCPYPNPPQRSIDVYSIGRRSEPTHQILLKMARENRIFYVYDSINDYHVFNTTQHRLLLANMAKRSRYFIVNPGKIDTPEETGNQIEFGARFFEGAASGSIMIGEIPKNIEFNKIFFWPDAVIHVPFGSEKIDNIINELDRQPYREERIRKKNIAESLLHHDWVYRWETILQTAGLKPLPGVLERKERLEKLARLVEGKNN